MSAPIQHPSRLIPVAPLELLAVPTEVDGSAGTNRAHGAQRQIAADNDVDAIKVWLARFFDNRTTFDNYRKEAERLLLWSTLQLGKPVSSLTHEDWLVYQAFIRDPQPRERWIASEGRKFPRAHQGWRPFAGPLSASSQRQAAVKLLYLRAADLGNNCKQHGRVLLSARPGRRGAMVAKMLGKGDQLRIVPATKELMVELARYRRELSYPAYPVAGESTPLLLPIGGKARPLSRGGIHEIIKGVFAMTSARLRQRGPEYAHAAERVLQASAHGI